MTNRTTRYRDDMHTYESSAKNPERQAAMFSRIARHYDLINDLASLGRDRMWRRTVTDELERACHGLDGREILDVACGTGTSSRALANRGAIVTGCDISPGMLDVARRKEAEDRRATRPPIRYECCDAQHLPFTDRQFDAVTTSYGLRNMPDPRSALADMRRVCRPGAPIIVLDFDTPDNPVWRAIYERYRAIVLPALGDLLGGNGDAYRYLDVSIDAWKGRAGVAAMLCETGWHDVAYRTLSGSIASICRARA
ncbi:ubiquinone/menaquinone biosynthesis methyltransferase [Bifidobacterium callimiconis]|uniref:ubiquinone/menaquinone biosynthesis methyltransferase n=1 Tax=Bifidobacterium callimiconis TaxID=2306973 RepID=UPI001BDC845C|nr:ubiquinone/menaquinone biosynthesis methyltransferase [Bifidobacterium callimiconis]